MRIVEGEGSAAAVGGRRHCRVFQRASQKLKIKVFLETFLKSRLRHSRCTPHLMPCRGWEMSAVAANWCSENECLRDFDLDLHEVLP